jgi:hypothetical protein
MKTTQWRKELRRYIEQLEEQIASGKPYVARTPSKKEIERSAESIKRQIFSERIREEVEDYTYNSPDIKSLLMAVAIEHRELRPHILRTYGKFLLPPPKKRGCLANWKTYIQQILFDWETFDKLETIILDGRCKSPTKACELLACDDKLYRSPKRGRKGENESPESRYRKAYKRHTETCFHPASSRRAKLFSGNH